MYDRPDLYTDSADDILFFFQVSDNHNSIYVITLNQFCCPNPWVKILFSFSFSSILQFDVTGTRTQHTTFGGKFVSQTITLNRLFVTDTDELTRSFTLE